MKTSKIIKILLLIFIILSVILCVLNPTLERFDKGPNYVEEIIKFDLPYYSEPKRNYVVDIVDGDGNELSSPTESSYYNARFSEPLSEDCIRKLNELCANESDNWKMNPGKYFSYDYTHECRGYHIYCSINNDGFFISYTTPLSSGVIEYFLLFLGLFGLFILLIKISIWEVYSRIRKKY